MIIAYREKIRLLKAENRMLKLEKQELIEYYSRDSSTGFLTKRSLRPAIQDLLTKKIIFCFAVIDLDNFKKVNDEHGHIIGDQMLLDVAQIIKEKVRTSDIVVRFGGDEMMLIMPNAEINNAYAVLERIRHAIERKNLYGVTVSIGLVKDKIDDTVEGIIQRADSMMYAAKGNGKNQIAYDK